MCGLVGLYKFNKQKITEKELYFLTNSLKHRGPDAQNIFINDDQDFGLGHTRLSIQDLTQNGIQPMSYKNNKYQIIFNGEIYNFVELRKELEDLGCNFVTKTDTEVILASYDMWGEECQFKFNGMWAFAIWNKYKNNIFLSRDRFGAKPLYYFLNEKKIFAFASELKSFCHIEPNYRPGLNHEILSKIKINDYIKNQTMFKDVLMLPQGHSCIFDMNRGILNIHQWWQTDKNLITVSANFEEQVAGFKEIFFDACKIRMRSDVPIATALSGGLDSTSVCAVIKKIRKNNLLESEKFQNKYATFTYDNTNYHNFKKNNEIQYAQEVTKESNIDHYIVDQAKYQKLNIEEYLYKCEDIGDPLTGPYLVYKTMSDMGYKVSIDGHAADELLGGYPHYTVLALKDIELGLSDDNFKNIYQIIKNQNKEKKNSIKDNLKFLIGKKVVDFLKKVLIFLRIKKKEKQHLYLKNFVTDQKNKKFNNLNIELYNDFNNGNLQSILHRFDKISMSSGVESRTPFLDWRLVCYSFSLPSTTKIGKSFTKLILRESMKQILPEKVRLRRDKFGFRMPRDFEMFFYKDYVLDNVNSSYFKENIFFDPKIKELINKNYSYTNYKIAFRQVQLLKILKIFSSV